ncbi:hypothetical protein M7I_0674 [Glarea lozoyensis 74030]|uniref:Uncharacterized protein n=1 Tax=Glarea lozoyensis (strain ATCC 74030 / MF5533) TaxID=1104152 RepID=H0EE06_GLAL7|nr:hypothetical protein M7I_0674 [Glarea lozoyensis 74030]
MHWNTAKPDILARIPVICSSHTLLLQEFAKSNELYVSDLLHGTLYHNRAHASPLKYERDRLGPVALKMTKYQHHRGRIPKAFTQDVCTLKSNVVSSPNKALGTEQSSMKSWLGRYQER